MILVHHQVTKTSHYANRYWVNRLVPVVQDCREKNKEIYFVCSNRIGIERGTSFVGGSCVLSLRKPELLIAAHRFEETVLVTVLD